MNSLLTCSFVTIQNGSMQIDKRKASIPQSSHSFDSLIISLSHTHTHSLTHPLTHSLTHTRLIFDGNFVKFSERTLFVFGFGKYNRYDLSGIANPVMSSSMAFITDAH